MNEHYLETYEQPELDRLGEEEQRLLGATALFFVERTDPVGYWQVDYDENGNTESQYAL